MISIGDFVGFTLGYEDLRGIVVAGPRVDAGVWSDGQSFYCVMWDPTTTPEHWEPRPKGAWEAGSNIKVLSSLETRWV